MKQSTNPARRVKHAIILDYDGCFDIVFQSQWHIDMFKDKTHEEQNDILWSIRESLFLLPEYSQACINKLLRKTKNNQSCWKKFTPACMKTATIQSTLIRKLTKLIKKSHLLAAQCKIDELSESETSAKIESFAVSYKLIIEFIQYVFITELIDAGFDIKQDSLLLLNGSMRQIKSLDELGNEYNKTGKIGDELANIAQAMRELFAELGMKDVNTRITHSDTTSCDSKDDQCSAIKYGLVSERLIDPSKLGLWLEQLHYAKRKGCQNNLIFDDRLIPQMWLRHSDGTQDIDQAFKTLRLNPHALPKGTTTRLVLFISYRLSEALQEGVEDALNEGTNKSNFYGLNAGPVGSDIQGTGPTRQRGAFKDVLRPPHSATFNNAKEQLEKILKPDLIKPAQHLPYSLTKKSAKTFQSKYSSLRSSLRDCIFQSSATADEGKPLLQKTTHAA